MKTINLSKHIWEGWTAQDFVNELEPVLDRIMNGDSYIKPIKNKQELKDWVCYNQPYYKKPIKEVQQYFAQRYSIK